MAGQTRREESLANAITIDRQKNGAVVCVRKTYVWSRSRCRRCQTGMPASLQSKHMRVRSPKKTSWSESSSSRHGVNKILACKAKWAMQTELRELREEVKRLREGAKCSPVQGPEAIQLAEKDEIEKREVHDEGDRSRKLELWKREIVKHMRKLEEVTELPQHVAEEEKEKWRQELQEMVQKCEELMPEHLRMQKMAQTLHSLQGRKMQCQKNADKWSKENEQFLKNIEELRTRVDENGARIKSDALAEAELDNEIKSLSVWRRKKRKLRVTVKGVLEVCSESCLPTE